MQKQIFVLGNALLEHIALDGLRMRYVGTELKYILKRHFSKPFRIVAKFCGILSIKSYNFFRLLFVKLRVFQDLLARQACACCCLVARVANHSGKVTDEQNYSVSQFLKLRELQKRNHMPHMKCRARWVNTEIQRKRFLALEMRFQKFDAWVNPLNPPREEFVYGTCFHTIILS